MAWYSAGNISNSKNLPTYMEDFYSQINPIGESYLHLESGDSINLRGLCSNIICSETYDVYDGTYDYVYKFFDECTGSSEGPFSKKLYMYNSNWDYSCTELDMDGYPYNAIVYYDEKIDSKAHIITNNYNTATPWNTNPVINTFGNYYTYDFSSGEMSEGVSIGASDNSKFHTITIFDNHIYAVNSKGELAIRDINDSLDSWTIKTGRIEVEGSGRNYLAIKKLFTYNGALFAIIDSKIYDCNLTTNSFNRITSISCDGYGSKEYRSSSFYIDYDNNIPFCKDEYLFVIARLYNEETNEYYNHLCKININTGKLTKVHTIGGEIQNSAAITPSGNIYAYYHKFIVSNGHIQSEDYTLEQVAQSSYKSYNFPLLINGNTIKSKYKIFPISNNLLAIDDYTIRVTQDGSVEIGQMDVDSFEIRTLVVY